MTITRVVCFLVALWSSFGQASYVLDELPTAFVPNSQSFAVRTMGGSCLAMLSIQDGVPCAASLLPVIRSPRFFATGQIGNGFEAAKTTNDILYKPISKTELENLFSQKNQLQADGSLKFTFVSSAFAAEFAPYQAHLNGVLRNASYPVIGLHALNEKRLLFSGAKEVWENVTVGSHLRLFQRRYVHEEIQMFQMVTNSGAIVRTREQSGVFFDPSVTWWSGQSDNDHQTRLTVGIENLGWVSRTDAYLSTASQWVAGWGYSLPLGLGLLEAGIDARPRRAQAIDARDFVLGTNYRLGGLQFLAGINQDTLNGGVSFALKQINLGVSYYTTRWPSGDSEAYQQSLRTQFSVGF